MMGILTRFMHRKQFVVDDNFANTLHWFFIKMSVNTVAWNIESQEVRDVERIFVEHIRNNTDYHNNLREALSICSRTNS
jgi:hypothetical protein